MGIKGGFAGEKGAEGLTDRVIFHRKGPFALDRGREEKRTISCRLKMEQDRHKVEDTEEEGWPAHTRPVRAGTAYAPNVVEKRRTQPDSHAMSKHAPTVAQSWFGGSADPEEKGGCDMPGGDRTGPLGFGPMTGRAAGYCAGYPFAGFMNPFYGRGFARGWSGYPLAGLTPNLFGRGRGMGFGRGGGRGRRNRFFSYGLSPRPWAAGGWPMYPMGW